MGTQIVLQKTYREEKKSTNVFTFINNFINKERTNYYGLAALYMTVGTAIASLTVAFAVFGNINVFIYMTAIFLAMMTNVSAISLQSFKTTTWLFIISVLINVSLLVYQLVQLF